MNNQPPNSPTPSNTPNPTTPPTPSNVSNQPVSPTPSASQQPHQPASAAPTAQPAPSAHPAHGGPKVYEMQWDCRFCGTKKLLGKTHRFCPNCGGQQDPSWRYFPSDAEKVAVQDHVYVGADKICPACKTLNSANTEFCINCGAPLTKAAEAKKLAGRTAAQGTAFETEDLKARQKAQQLPASAPAPVPAARPKGRRNTCLVVLALLVVIIGGGAFALTRTQSSTVSVTGYRWERDINIDSLQPVSGSVNGSCFSNAPSGAYNTVDTQGVVGSHQEADGQTCTEHQEDQGDGTFKEEEECSTKYKTVDDYGPVCKYTVNEWQHERTATAQGDKTNAPAWPDTSTLKVGNLIGSERESNRTETYYLELKANNSDKTYECAVPVDEWNSTQMNASFNVQIGAVLKDIHCDTLKPA